MSELDDFNSFMKIAQGEQKEGNYDHIYGAFMNNIRMIRSDAYKLILLPEAEETLLFDVNRDPEEMKNLYGEKKYNDIAIGLYSQFNKLKEAKNDTVEFDFLYPELSENSN